MTEKQYFPFGEELKKVEQKDRSPKKAFLLGVYASAVHARWIDKNGKQKVSALAIASEPEIFWQGCNAMEIISSIKIPEELGRLTVPSSENMNGPSGNILDKMFLKPLKLDRSSTWLCDLLPESRVNEHQRIALEKHYSYALVSQFNLPPANIPDFDKSELNSEERREDILKELEESKADTLILLGDLPIKWFLHFYDKRFSKLSDFGKTEESYGLEKELNINGKLYKVIALCHPRQAGKLGRSDVKWGELHANWMKIKNHEQLIY